MPSRGGAAMPLRDFLPSARVVRTTLRTTHLIAFGALYGGHVYAVDASRLHPALYATLASGAAMMTLEIVRHPVWVVQVRGLATFVKVALVASVALAWNERVWLLTAVIVVGAVVSHMPGRYRYYSIVHRRVVGGQERG
jgi:hypothetical protein